MNTRFRRNALAAILAPPLALPLGALAQEAQRTTDYAATSAQSEQRAMRQEGTYAQRPLISVSQLTNRAVFDEDGNRLGRIRSVVQNQSDQGFLVVSLSDGSRDVLAPFDHLKWRNDHYVLENIDDVQLRTFDGQRAKSFDRLTPSHQVFVAGFERAQGVINPAAAQTSDYRGAQVIVRQPQPQISVRQAEPLITVHQPQPEVTVQQQQPQIIVKQAPPTVTINQPQPEIIVRTADPNVSVNMPKPEVQVQMPRPQVRVAQPEQPQARVSATVDQGQPQVRVIRDEGQPDISVSRTQPQVQYQRTGQPKVEYHQQQGQPRIRYESIDSGDDNPNAVNPGSAQARQLQAADGMDAGRP